MNPTCICGNLTVTTPLQGFELVFDKDNLDKMYLNTYRRKLVEVYKSAIFLKEHFIEEH